MPFDTTNDLLISPKLFPAQKDTVLNLPAFAMALGRELGQRWSSVGEHGRDLLGRR